MNLKRRYPIKMRKPWRVSPNPKHNRKFKKALLKDGKLSPHFSIASAKCKDGTRVPGHLLANAQELAFTLEKVRHDAGDKPIIPLSWYRTEAYNRSIGGATLSQHVQARAMDPNRPAMQNAGMNLEKFDRACQRRFSNGGIGTNGSTNDAAHVDVRGYRSRWTY